MCQEKRYRKSDDATGFPGLRLLPRETGKHAKKDSPRRLDHGLEGDKPRNGCYFGAVKPGKLSVRKGEAGNPSRLNRLHTG